MTWFCAQSRCRASLERFPSQVLMGGGNGWALEARTLGVAMPVQLVSMMPDC